MMSLRGTYALAVVLAGPSCAALAQEVSLEIREEWGAVFGGAQVTFHAEIGSADALRGRLAWRLASDGRTLIRGETGVDVRAGEPAAVEVPLAIPEVKAGVVIGATLSVGLAPADAAGLSTNVDKLLGIFAADPFSGRKEWLEDLEIRLFDPEERTSELFEKMEIPFKPVSGPDAFAGLEQGVVIVGEGVSFDDYKGLPAAMVAAVAKGARVLCLAPAGGKMPIPGARGVEGPQPRTIRFCGTEVIAELDKRLDAKSWPPDGKIVAWTLALNCHRNLVSGELTDAEPGWPWFEAEFPSRGRLVVCGFAVAEKWETGPAPRYLLARILEYITENAREKEEDR